MKIPCDVTFHPRWWYKNARVSFNRDFFFNPSYRIEADMEMRRVLYDKFGDLGMGDKNPLPRPLLGTDLIASGFLHSYILGCNIIFSDEDPPVVECLHMNEDMIMSMKTPELSKSEVWGLMEYQADYLKKKFGYVEPCINLMGVQNIALDLRGSELFIDYYENPLIAEKLLSISTDISIAIGKKLKSMSSRVSAGVTSIIKKTFPDVYLTSNCTVEMISLELYEKYLLKYDNLLSEVFPEFGIHHCGQTMEHIVDGYKKVNNLVFAEVGAFSDIQYVRSRLPDIHLNARYSPVKLKDVTTEEVKRDLLHIINSASPINLLSISCVGIDDNISDSQVRSFLMNINS